MKKKIISLLLAVVMIVGMLPLSVVTAFAEEDTTHITNASDWAVFAADVTNGNAYEGKTVSLDGDITVSAPIGNWDAKKAFSGTFEGNGHTVTFNNTESTGNKGVFAYTIGATVRNLKVSGEIGGVWSLGGIVGCANTTEITNCENNATITSTGTGDVAYAGGIVGVSEGGCVISDCKNHGSISGNRSVGGILGEARDNDVIKNCINTAAVSGVNAVGGILGNTVHDASKTVLVANCINYGNITVAAGGDNGGGIAGNMAHCGTVKNCFTSGLVSNVGSSGIVIGWANRNFTCENCYYQILDGNDGMMAIKTDNSYLVVKNPTATGVETKTDADMLAAMNEKAAENDGWKYWCDENGKVTFSEIYYLDRIVGEDGTVSTKISSVASCISITANDTGWGDGGEKPCWYLLENDVTLNNSLVVNGDVRLILMNGKTLTANYGFIVRPDSSLSIYAQSDDESEMGVLSITNDREVNAAIGGINGESVGYSIHGFDGGDGNPAGTVRFFGGKSILSSTDTVVIGGGNGGSGVVDGYGGKGGDGGSVYFYGGYHTLTATNAKAIGGGKGGNSEISGKNGADGADATVTVCGMLLMKAGDSADSAAAVTEYDGQSYLQVSPATEYYEYNPSTKESECKLTQTIPTPIVSIDDHLNLSGGWYIVSGEVTVKAVYFSSDTHIILANDAVFTAKSGIAVKDGSNLTFYAQTDDYDQMGKVKVTNAYDGNAGIGSHNQGECGNITINGGVFYVQGGINGAGIGGGADSICGTITINGGKVFAIGGAFAAGIGSGSERNSGYENTCAGVVINGGVILAAGNDGAESIGAGYGSSEVTVTYAEGVYVPEEDACTYVNIEHHPETEHSCVDGHKEYFKNRVNGRYYTTETLEPESLIEDIDAWLAGEGNTGKGDGNHKDTNEDGYCDTCGTLAQVEVEYYIYSNTDTPKFTVTCKAGEKLLEQIDGQAVSTVEETFGALVGIGNHLYANGYTVNDYDLVPFGTESIKIYAMLVYDEIEPSCTNNGHKAYYENTLDGYFYEDAYCSTYIGDADALNEWLSDGGLNGEAKGHTWEYLDGTKHKCSVCEAEENHADDGTGKCSKCECAFCEHENTEIVYEWDEEYLGFCTAKRVCSDCHKVLETTSTYAGKATLVTAGGCQSKTVVYFTVTFDEPGFGTATSENVETVFGYHRDENGDGICDDCEANLTGNGSVFTSGIFQFKIIDSENKKVRLISDKYLQTVDPEYPLDNYVVLPTSYTGDIVVPESVTYAGNTYTVTEIGASVYQDPADATFFECDTLTSVTLPDSITLIGEAAFIDCVGLTEIVIPENVESICSTAFWGCNNLKTVTFKSRDITKAPHGDIVVIPAFDPKNGVETVRVPIGTVDAYKEEWSNFANIIVADNKINYLDENGKGKIADCIGLIVSTVTEYTDGWYVLTEDAVFNNAIVINGDVKFILCDGATLTANKGILLTEGNSLTVYAQSTGENMGRIIATGADLCAGIGSGFRQNAGDFTVNGGYVKATGGYAAKGIGGGFGGKDGTFTKNAGIVESIDGEGYVSGHEHTFSADWSHNSINHWHNATCEHNDIVSGFAAHTFDDGVVDGNKTVYTCVVCGYKKEVYNIAGGDEGEIIEGTTYTGISLTLGSDVSINFYMELTEEARQDGIMTFNIGGRIVTLSGTDAKHNEKEDKWFFQTPLTALEMNEPVVATFTYNGVDYVQEYSVMEYIEVILNGKDKDGKPYSDEAKMLARKIANYGYYAQTYLASIHTNVTIGEGGYTAMDIFSDADINVNTAKNAIKDYKVIVSGTSDNLSLYGSTVYFDSATALNYYVTVKNGVKPTATAVNTVTNKSKDVEIKLYKNNIWIVSVKDITATELADDIKVTVNGEITLTGSVFAYCNSVVKAHDVAEPTEKDIFAVNAMSAFYEYYKAAVEYAETQD